MSERLKSALFLAETYGLPVFRLVPGGRTPARKNWQEEATTDPDEIRMWWAGRDWNVGVLMGRGFLGLDIDMKNGKNGEAAFAELGIPEDEQDTLTVRTAKGGRHLYFRSDRTFSNSAGGLGDGLDVRGRGGYLVGPGSVLTNGDGSGAYAIERLANILGLPAGLESRLGARRDADVRATSLVDLDDHNAVLRSRSWLQDAAPLAVEHRAGDHTTFTVAARLKDFGVSEIVAFELMLDHWNDRCSPPWLYDELKTKVENAYRYGQNPPGSEHPQALFGSVLPVEPPVTILPKSVWFRHGESVWSPAEAKWTFYETVPHAGTMVLVGPTNSGKTFLEIEIARCVATGRPFFGIEPDEKGGVIFLFAGTEGSGFARRVMALQEAQALPISAAIVQNLSDKDALTNLLALIKDEAARMEVIHGVKLRMVVLETLSASGLLLDENSNAEAGRAMTNLGQLANALDVVFVTTHHPPKDGKGGRGAGAIINSADYVLEIYREGRETLRHVELTKARDAEQRRIGTFTLTKVVLGKDKKDRDVTSMVVSMGEAVRPTAGRTPAHMETFTRAWEFTEIEADGDADLTAVELEFAELTPTLDKIVRARAFRKCLDFARGLGAFEEQLIHGIRYMIRKVIE